MGETGALASSSPSFGRIRPVPALGSEAPIHSPDSLAALAASADERVALWAARTLIRMLPAEANDLLLRLSEAGPAVREAAILAAIEMRAPLGEAALGGLLDREEEVRDLALLASLLCGPALPVRCFEPSPAGRIAFWISDKALGTEPRLLPVAGLAVPESVEWLLLEASAEWLAALPMAGALRILAEATRLPSPEVAALAVSALAARLGMPETADHLSGILDLSRRPELAQSLFAPIRKSSPWAFNDPSILEPARSLACASPARAGELAPLALQMLRALRRAPQERTSDPAWAAALASHADRTRREAEELISTMAVPGRLGPCAGVAGPLMAAALLATARDGAWAAEFRGKDDDRTFVRALCRARGSFEADAAILERAEAIPAGRFVDLVTECARGGAAGSLRLPLDVLESGPDEVRVDATLKLMLTLGESGEMAETLLDSLRTLGWSALPRVAEAHRFFPSTARNAALEYLAEFPCRRTMEALLDAFPFYARSEWPGRYWEALAGTGAWPALEKLCREWRPGEVTIARAIAFMAEIHPQIRERRRAIFEDLEAHERALEAERPPLLLPLHCKACGRTSEHLIQQVILTGEDLENAAPDRVLLCKYCGAVESWRHTRESLARFDEALGLELDEIARRGTIPAPEARFLDSRRSGREGWSALSSREQWGSAQKRLAASPEDPEALLVAGRLLRRGGWTRQAVAPLAKLVARHPDHLEGRIEWAFLKMDRRQIDEAAVEYERAAAMFCCTSLTEEERIRIAGRLDRLACALQERGRVVRRVTLETDGRAPTMAATACFGGYEPSNGETFEEMADRIARELSGEKPCPCGSGSTYRECCGTVVWHPFVS